MAITTLGSKLYLHCTTLVSIKNSSTSQLLFLEAAMDMRGKGWAGVGRTERCSWVLLFGRNPAGHPLRPQAGCSWALSLFFCGFAPSHGQVSLLQSPRCGAGASDKPFQPFFLGDAQVQLTASCNLIPQHLHRAAFHTHCTMAALKKRQGENRNEPIPAFFKVNWKEQRPTQVTPFLERLQSLFLHIFISALQISFWLIARNPALSPNASSHLHSGTVKVPSFSLFLHFNFSRCTSLDN